MLTPRDPFELTLADDQRQYLAWWLNQELTNGLAARASQEADVDYWHQLYEQARTRLRAKTPWPDAADLTSYLASEKVDALHARILRSIWSDPVWTVEGWGDAANRAPAVEEFHQWKVEEERLQSVLDKLVLISLIEPRGLLEIAEGTEHRLQRKRVTARVQRDQITGGPIFDENGQPLPELGPDGKYAEATADELGVEMVIDEQTPVRTGPSYRVLPYRDSVILPGHAREDSEIWGYGKRIWKRWSQLKTLAQGRGAIYDADAVERMGQVDDRETQNALQRSQTVIVPSEEMAEKELWEILLLLNLEQLFESHQLAVPRSLRNKGECWFLVTLHPQSQQLLRIQFDDLERSRFVPIILFPRPDRATEGFSFIGHKLLTIIEEHTTIRNLRADREVLVNQAPIQRVQGSLWDPFSQPFGPSAVIDIRQPGELIPFIIPGISPSMIQWEQNVERTAERVAGINDIASGQIASESRTLGEIQMATTNSEIRMDLITRRLQEAMETIAQIRHAIWKRTLASRREGEELPPTLIQNLEGRGVSIDEFLPDKKVTAALLDGAFRFKPHGSVETADVNRQRNDFVGMMQALGPLLQAFPMLAMMFRTPEAARAMGRQFLRVFRIPNAQAFLGSPAQDLQRSQEMAMYGLMGLPQAPTRAPGGSFNPPGEAMGLGASAPGPSSPGAAPLPPSYPQAA